MITHNLGYPRIGPKRELKKAAEKYWKGKTNLSDLLNTGQQIRHINWDSQYKAGLDLVSVNDFSYYDHVLDMAYTVGAIPKRYEDLAQELGLSAHDQYFAMARGYQDATHDVIAMEMTKWFDSNYHYIVPEFTNDQDFQLNDQKIFEEFKEAKEAGYKAKPVLVGPVSFLLLGKGRDEDFDRLALLDRLLPVYQQILDQLKELGAEWVQLDEPYLTLNLDQRTKDAFTKAYQQLGQQDQLKLLVATYFEGIRDNAELAANLNVDALHLDLVRAPEQLETVLPKVPANLSLSLGVVNGRNVWKNDYDHSLNLINKAVDQLGLDRVLIGSSCSLLLSPYDLDLETNEKALTPEIKNWLAFAKQKVGEIATLGKLADPQQRPQYESHLAENQKAIQSRRESELIHNNRVKERVKNVKDDDYNRKSPFSERRQYQDDNLNLPKFPTTTIGSFPQTQEIRKLRRQLRKQEIKQEEYDEQIKEATKRAIKWQEDIGLDVLVHGEFERNDMVEYFGEQLEGFAFTEFGWVQSFGTRCVKPPIIYGDVERKAPMTTGWISYGQEQTNKPVKGMLTGPVTMLEWSFVRDDQHRSQTAQQVGLAIRGEVQDLENEGIKVIQIDEPALREGLPLRQEDWSEYLNWAVNAFRLASTGVKDETQIHTHMCYAEFNDIIESIGNMDADVITIETSRSQMELLDAFVEYQYPNQIGPGVYDIHSPRIPSKEEMEQLIQKAASLLPAENLWVNPDCGLKTRNWEETEAALRNMVDAAKELRAAEVVEG
jgi:5-methyltetrahydropteroyltriglutamate--homocysteine methyltransferase